MLTTPASEHRDKTAFLCHEINIPAPTDDLPHSEMLQPILQSTDTSWTIDTACRLNDKAYAWLQTYVRHTSYGQLIFRGDKQKFGTIVHINGVWASQLSVHLC